jgi:hypothetical protein
MDPQISQIFRRYSFEFWMFYVFALPFFFSNFSLFTFSFLTTVEPGAPAPEVSALPVGTVPNLRNSNDRISVILGTVPDQEQFCARGRTGGRPVVADGVIPGTGTKSIMSPIHLPAVPVAFAQSGHLVPVSECRGIHFSATAESFRGSLQADRLSPTRAADSEPQIPEWLPATLCVSVAKPANAPCYQMLGESGRAFKRPCGICLQTCGTWRNAASFPDVVSAAYISD